LVQVTELRRMLHLVAEQLAGDLQALRGCVVFRVAGPL
jgi:hypothetical protein